MNVLCLSRYDSSGASSRYRFYQYFPYLRGQGIRIDEAPLVGGDYIDSLYVRGRRDRLEFVRAGLGRLRALLRSHRYDVLWTEKELLPYFPAVLERVLHARGANLVLDFDDAIFHQYDRSESALVRAFLGKKIDRAMRSARLVVAGNEYLAARARSAGARVEVIPTVVDLERYPVSPVPPGRPFTLGWIGTPATQVYLAGLAPVLAEACRGGATRVLAIGPRTSFSLPGVPLEVKPWSEEQEAPALQEFDVGLMPLPDTPWARGKCGLKLVQYMASGRPVVASPVGANRDIVEHGKTGYLASSDAEWLSAISELRSSRELRERMGRAGRARAESSYSLAAAAPRLALLLTQVARGG